MSQDIGDQFLFTCKKNYFDKVTPSNIDSRPKEGYKKLVNIANEYFKRDEYETFAGFFQEGQYFIQLWAAHLLIEYGKPSQDIISSAIGIIKDYADNSLSPEVSKEEQQWLVLNEAKYR
jgi:hypothetical protein